MSLALVLVLASGTIPQDPLPAKPTEPETVVVRPQGRTPRVLDPEVERGLRWLASAQNADGAFCSEHASDQHTRIGLTGLSLLAFLASGTTRKDGAYAKTAAEAIGWLRGQIDKDGLIGTMSSRTATYQHAVATLALATACRLYPDDELRKDVARAAAWIEKARNPYKVWRYFPHDGDNDSSVTGWMVAALAASRDAGVPVSDETWRYARAWFVSPAARIRGNVAVSR